MRKDYNWKYHPHLKSHHRHRHRRPPPPSSPFLLSVFVLCASHSSPNHNINNLFRGCRDSHRTVRRCQNYPRKKTVRKWKWKNWFNVVSEHREEILISFIKLLQDKKKEWVMEEKRHMRKEQKEKRRWWSFRKRESGAE